MLLNEVDTMPGFAPRQRLREALGNQGRAVTRLCELAIERHAHERTYRFGGRAYMASMWKCIMVVRA